MWGESVREEQIEWCLSIKSLTACLGCCLSWFLFPLPTCQTRPFSLLLLLPPSLSLSICPSLSLIGFSFFSPPPTALLTDSAKVCENLLSKSPFRTSLIKQRQKSFHINDAVSGEGLFMNNTNYHLSLSVIFARGCEGHVRFDIKQNAHNLSLPSIWCKPVHPSLPPPPSFSLFLISLFTPFSCLREAD